MTNYYKDHMTFYKSESKVAATFKFINKLFENSKIANIAGFCGAILPVIVMVLK